MIVQLPKTAVKKLEFHEREFAEFLMHTKDPKADTPSVGFHPLNNTFEIADEYGFTEDEVKDAYKKFKLDPTWYLPDWQKKMRELYIKEDTKGLTDDEEKELQKLERRDRKQRLGLGGE